MAADSHSTTRNAPTLTWGLGLLALLPFIAGAYVAIGGTAEAADRALDWLLVYATTIVSFIGGIQWGLQIAGKRARLVDMTIAVCPALIAWIGVMWVEPWRFVLIIVALALAWLADENGRHQGWMPLYLLILRRVLSITVLVCLAIIAGSVLLD